MDDRPTISTHVLDTAAGLPASGVVVTLSRLESGTWMPAGTGTTDEDGRIRRLLATELAAGDYRIDFDVDGEFFRRASISFRVSDTSRSYHVPLLVAPYSLSSYRGS